MHADMLQCVNNFKAEVGELGGRVDHIEKKIRDFASSHNTLIDAHNDHADDITWLKTKVAELEDGSRRNNVKIRGITEVILPAQLQHYARDLIKVFLPSLPESEMTVDRSYL